MNRFMGWALAALSVFVAWSIAGTQIAAAALALAFVANGGLRSAPSLRGATLAFTGLCMASVLASWIPWETFELTAWKPALLVWVVAGAVVMLGRAEADRAAVAWMVAALVASSWACIQAVSGADLLFLLHLRAAPVVIASPGWAGHAAATGFFNSRLTFSLAMLPALGCAGGFAASSGGCRRILGITAAIILMLALAVGFVRAAWWGAAVASLILLVLGPRSFRRPAAVLAAGALVLVAVTPQLRARALSSLRVSENEDRVFIWARAGEVIAAHPIFGTGFGAYPRAAEPFYDRAAPSFPMHTWAHDTPLSLLAEVGPLGLLLYLLLWGVVFAVGWPAIRGGSPAALGLFAGIAGLHVASLFHDVLYNGEVAFALYLAGGLLAGMGLTESRADS